jgi:hypothetical protein
MKQSPLNPRLPHPYNKMTSAELDAEVAKFNREMPGLPGKPLTPSQKAQHRRARKMGRPITGKGAKRIAVTMERTLLGKLDSYARKNHITRSATIAEGIKHLLKAS